MEKQVKIGSRKRFIPVAKHEINFEILILLVKKNCYTVFKTAVTIFFFFFLYNCRDGYYIYIHTHTHKNNNNKTISFRRESGVGEGSVYFFPGFFPVRQSDKDERHVHICTSSAIRHRRVRQSCFILSPSLFAACVVHDNCFYPENSYRTILQ